MTDASYRTLSLQEQVQMVQNSRAAYEAAHYNARLEWLAGKSAHDQRIVEAQEREMARFEAGIAAMDAELERLGVQVVSLEELVAGGDGETSTEPAKVPDEATAA